jgi:hypothetical protein
MNFWQLFTKIKTEITLRIKILGRAATKKTRRENHSKNQKILRGYEFQFFEIKKYQI